MHTDEIATPVVKYTKSLENNGIMYNNIPLSNNSVKNHYRRILKETLKIIHSRYEEKINMRQNAQLNTAAASLSQTGQPKTQSQPHNQAPSASADKSHQMTMSRAINYARLFLTDTVQLDLP